MRILGALGPSLHAPLLAEDAGRRCVLDRPSPEGLIGYHRVGIAVGERPFVVDGRALAVYRWIPGMDVGLLLDHHPELPPSVVRYLVDGVRRRLAEAPVSHGALRSSQVRVEPGGPVWLVGFRDSGEDGVDLLVSEWGTPGEPDPLQAEAWLQEHVDPQAELFEHPWVGREVGPKVAEAEPNKVPVKVRIARVAGLTLILGLVSGALVGHSLYGYQESAVAVDGATEIVVKCEQVMLRTGSERLILPPNVRRCSVEATLSSDRSVEGDLRVTLPGTYRCAPHDGVLRCTAP